MSLDPEELAPIVEVLSHKRRVELQACLRQLGLKSLGKSRFVFAEKNGVKCCTLYAGHGKVKVAVVVSVGPAVIDVDREGVVCPGTEGSK